MLDSLTPRLRSECLRVFCEICGCQALLPKSLLRIPPCYDQSEDPLYRGGFADVWEGEYQGHQVAVKVPRVYSASDFDKTTKVFHHQKSAESTSELTAIVQMFCREVMMWKSLHHPNVLPLLGVTVNDGHFAMVSEWMTNGNVNEFVEAHRNVNRFEPVGFCSYR